MTSTGNNGCRGATTEMNNASVKKPKAARKFTKNIVQHLCKTRKTDSEGYTMFVKEAEKKLERDSFLSIVKGAKNLPQFKFNESVLFHIMKLHTPKFDPEGIFSRRRYTGDQDYIDPYVTHAKRKICTISELRKHPIFKDRADFSSSAKFVHETAEKIRNKGWVKLMEQYEIQEKLHKAQEKHHPDSGSFDEGVWTGYEVCMDVFHCIYRQNKDLKKSWEIFVNVISGEKFKNVNRLGIYYFLIRVNQKGFSFPAAPAYYREYPLGAVWNMDDVVMDMYRETMTHALQVSREMQEVRCPFNHDWSKFTTISLAAYTVKWIFYENADMHGRDLCPAGTKEDRMKQIFRSRADTYPYSLNAVREDCIGEPTGLMDSANDWFETRGKNIIKGPMEKIEELAGSATATIESMKTAVHFTVESLSKQFSKFSFVKDFASMFIDAFTSFWKIQKSNFTSWGEMSYIYLFALFCIYQNSSSKIIKMAVGAMILDKLGLTTVISRVIMGKEYVENEDEEEFVQAHDYSTCKNCQQKFEDLKKYGDHLAKCMNDPKFRPSQRVYRRVPGMKAVTDGRCMYHSLAILLQFPKLTDETESEWIDRYMEHLKTIPTFTSEELDSISKKEWGNDIILEKIAKYHKKHVILVEQFEKENQKEISVNSFEKSPPIYLAHHDNHFEPLQICIEGEETSLVDFISLFVDFAKNHTAIIGTIAPAIGVMFLGNLIKPEHYKSLGNFVVEIMKNFHFVGAGMFGIDRIVSYSGQLINSILKWIREHIFGITDNVIDEEKKVQHFLIKCEFFATDAGNQAIKASSQARKMAADLFPEYTDYMRRILIDETILSKDTIRLLRSKGNLIRNIYNLCHRIQATSGFRPTPYHVQFVGNPGIGKSTLIKKFVIDLCKQMYALDCNGDNVPMYSYNPNIEHWTGYSDQRVVLIDDIFRMNEPVHMSLLIAIITNTPIALPMAHLEDKGAMFRSDYVVTTTNTPYPQVKDLYCVEAVWRRRHAMWKVEVDPDVYDKEAGQFRKELYDKKYPKIPSSEFPHLTFRIMKSVPDATNGEDMPYRISRLISQKNGVKKAIAEIMELNKLAKSSFEHLTDMEKTCIFIDKIKKEFDDSTLVNLYRNFTYQEMLQYVKLESIAMRQAETNSTHKEKQDKVFECFTEFDNMFQKDSGFDPMKFKDNLCSFVFEKPDLLDPDSEDMKAAENILRDKDDPIGKLLVEELKPKVEGEETALTLTEEHARRKKILLERAKQRGKLNEAIFEHPMVEILYKEDKTLLLLEPDRAEKIDRSYFNCAFDKIAKTVFDPQDINKPMSEGVMAKFPLSFIYKNLIPSLVDDERPMTTASGKLSLAFLARVREEDGQFYYEVPEHLAHLNYGIEYEKFKIHLTFPELLHLNERFAIQREIFLRLSLEEKRNLLLKSKSYFILLGTNPIQALVQAVQGAISKTKALFEWTKPAFDWCLEKFKKHWGKLLTVFTFVGIIFATRSFAQMILGIEGQETSTKPKHNISKAHIVWGSPTTLVLDDFIESLADRNVVNLKIQSKGGVPTQAQGFKNGQFILTVQHAIPEGDFIISYPPTTITTEEWTHYIKPEQVAFGNGDKALIFVPTSSFTKNRVSHFFTRDDLKKYDPFGRKSYLIRTNGEKKYITPRTAQQGQANINLISDKCNIKSDHGLFLYEVAVKGESGGTFVIENPEASGLRTIYGIQSWGPKAGGTYIQSVTQEDWCEMREEIERKLAQANLKSPISQVGPLTSVYTEDDVIEGDATFAKASRIVTEHIQPVYQISKQFIAGQVGKTKYRQSPLAPFMDTDGFGSARKPACFDYDPATKIDPLAHSVNKSGRHVVGPWNHELLDKAREGITSHFRSVLPRRQYRTDLSPEEIVEGTRRDGSNPMAIDTSVGLPDLFFKENGKKGKSTWIQMSEQGNASLDPDFVSRFEEFYEALTRGVIPPHSSYDFPKDELRPKEKARTKTRLVTTLNVKMTMAWRRVVLDLMSDLHVAARGKTPFAPGMNPMGPDWTTMFHYLNHHPCGVDFDVSNWDGHFPPELMYQCARLLCDLLNVGINSSVGNVIYSIVTEVLFGHVQFKDLIYQKQRGLQSGFPGTAEMNTIAHMILDLYLYLFIMQTLCPTYANVEMYFICVRNKIYGDDIIKTISKLIIEHYNGLTIAAAYEQHGYPVSSADKDSDILAQKPLMECQFLKSKFRILGPARVDRLIEFTTIYDLCYWYRSNFQGHQQFRENLIDACRFMHPYGKEQFNVFIRRVNAWLGQANEEPLIITWETLEREYVINNYINHAYYS